MKILKLIRKHWIISLLVLIALIISVIDVDNGISIANITWMNVVTIMGVLPPIFVFIGLLDVWVPKEVMIKFMGEKSGLLGLFFSFVLGSMAAGPLYAAFPVAAILLKKGARIAYVVFFLSTWTVAKIPLLLFEMSSLGIEFTIVHLVSMLSVFLVGSFVIERLLSKKDKKSLVERAIALG